VIFGLMRIAWIVVGSIFLYNVACETGQFDVMKDSIAGCRQTSACNWC
jgi:L-lactate permease